MFLPSDSFAVALYTDYDTDRTHWEESAQAQVVDTTGYYKMDHGFKNNKKMGNVPGQPTSVATLTCMTSEGKVAFQLDTASTSLKDVVPAIVQLQNRTRRLNAPVRLAHDVTPNDVVLSCCQGSITSTGELEVAVTW
jgi:hypothetical protein